MHSEPQMFRGDTAGAADGGRLRGVDARSGTRARASVMSEIAQLVVFRLDERRYALPLAVVEWVVRAVDVTPLPKAPAIVLGAINVQGRMLPVLNVRRRFLMPDREIGPADWFLLAHTARHTVVLVVDELEEVVERPQAEIVLSTQTVPGLEPFPGVLKLDDGLVLIHDLDRFLSSDEARALEEAMAAADRAYIKPNSVHASTR